MKKFLNGFAVLLLGCSVLFGGCAGSGSAGTSPVTVRVGTMGHQSATPQATLAAVGTSSALPTGIVTLRFTVKAPDMTPITQDLAVTGTATDYTFSVPNGTGRLFTVEALDSSGNVQFFGKQNADLNGTAVTLTIPMYYSPTFGYLYNGGPDELAVSLHPTPNGGYLLAGTEKDPTTYTSAIRLLSLRYDGQIFWEKRYQSGGSESVVGACPTTDGGYLVAGVSETASTAEMLLFKVSSSGDILWQSIYSLSGYETASDLIPSGDGGFYLLGTTYDMASSTPRSDILLVKLDSTGAIQWSRTYSSGGEAFSARLALGANGGVLVTGNITNPLSPEMMALKVDATGKLVWAQGFTADQALSAAGAAPVADGGFVLTGMANSNTSGASQILAMRLDPKGQPVWETAFSSGLSTGDVGASVTATADGAFVVSGGVDVLNSSGVANLDGLLLKLDANGSPIWQYHYGGDGDDFITAAPSLPNGYLIGAGSSFDTGTSQDDFFVATLRSDGTSWPGMGTATALTATPLTGLSASPLSITVTPVTLSSTPASMTATNTYSVMTDIQTLITAP